jgi:hypothetical protein
MVILMNVIMIVIKVNKYNLDGNIMMKKVELITIRK